MIVHRAAWLLPIASPPIRNGWVAVDEGRIVSLGADPATQPSQSTDQIAVLPALVNAHVHLELSGMRGTVPPAASMPEWATELIAQRAGRAEDPSAIAAAIKTVHASGTGLVGEVTNTLAAYGPLEKSALSAAVFYEQIGFRNQDATAAAARVREAKDRLAALPRNQRLHASVVPHAPYSVSPALLHAIATAEAGIVSVHLAESADEGQFLMDGTGAWRSVLAALGAWDDGWVCPACGPVDYLARAGLLHDRLLAVHGVQLTGAELSRLAAVNATVVTCPRSNRWTGAGAPPIASFYQSGVRVAVGTDSLASVEDLNVFAELAAMRALAPDVPAARLLESATRIGADALGFGAELGTIVPGKRAALLAVRVPAGVEDVEEYLVGGIEPRAVRWLT